MKLKKLLKDIPVKEVKGSKEIEITGVCSNSKLVMPGNLFIAKKGNTVDGANYIPEAISAGAAAVLTDVYDPTLRDVTQIIHPEVKAIEPRIAAQYHQFPCERLFMAAVTGTNGKTTTAYIYKHLLDHFKGPCGLVGTIEYIAGKHVYQATHTTPDVSTNQKLLREMVRMGCRSAVMEVTSHALDQGRVDCIDFDAAIFTNLTREHLDYHLTMDAYCKAKNKLFRQLGKGAKDAARSIAIVNLDDPYCRSMLEGCIAPVLTYGLNPGADVQASDLELTPEGSCFTLRAGHAVYSAKIPLPGRHNVYNALAAIACGISQQFSVETMLQLLETIPPVPARLEKVPNEAGLKIYVDFAHTPDALQNVLKCLKELNRGRIITVFGCGGNRDRTKRPVMARVCEELSDFSIVTSDNPRAEDPDAIIREILSGFSVSGSHIVETDRRQAIRRAVELAAPDDCILIAGKGHETLQIFAHHTVEFDDRAVALEACRLLKVPHLI